MSVDLSKLKKGMSIEIKGYGSRNVTRVKRPFIDCEDIFWVSFIEKNREVMGEYKKDGTAHAYAESTLIAKDGSIIAIK